MFKHEILACLYLANSSPGLTLLKEGLIMIPCLAEGYYENHSKKHNSCCFYSNLEKVCRLSLVERIDIFVFGALKRELGTKIDSVQAWFST